MAVLAFDHARADVRDCGNEGEGEGEGDGDGEDDDDGVTVVVILAFDHARVDLRNGGNEGAGDGEGDAIGFALTVVVTVCACGGSDALFLRAAIGDDVGSSTMPSFGCSHCTARVTVLYQ